MQYRDIFRLAIKLLAISFLIFNLFAILPRLLTAFDFYYGFVTVVQIILISGISIALSLLLIINSETIIGRLRLDQGFEKQLNLNIPSEQILLRLALIIISLFTLMNYIPSFIAESVLWFITSQNEQQGEILYDYAGNFSDFNLYNWMISILYIVIGFLVLSNYKPISKFLSKRLIEKDEQEVL